MENKQILTDEEIRNGSDQYADITKASKGNKEMIKQGYFAGASDTRDIYEEKLSEKEKEIDFLRLRAGIGEYCKELEKQLSELREENKRKQHFAESWYDEVEKLKEENKKKDGLLRYTYDIIKKYQYSSGDEGWLFGKLEQALNTKKQ
jgi:intein/homing endonuclease